MKSFVACIRKKALQGIDQVKGVIPILNNDVVISHDGMEHLIKRRRGVYHFGDNLRSCFRKKMLKKDL